MVGGKSGVCVGDAAGVARFRQAVVDCASGDLARPAGIGCPEVRFADRILQMAENKAVSLLAMVPCTMHEPSAMLPIPLCIMHGPTQSVAVPPCTVRDPFARLPLAPCTVHEPAARLSMPSCIMHEPAGTLSARKCMATWPACHWQRPRAPCMGALPDSARPHAPCTSAPAHAGRVKFSASTLAEKLTARNIDAPTLRRSDAPTLRRSEYDSRDVPSRQARSPETCRRAHVVPLAEG